MRALFGSLAAVAVLLVAWLMAPDADAAESVPPASGAPAAAAAPVDTGKPADAGKPAPPPQCLYRDAKYGLGAVICVAPKFGQQCDKDGKWTGPMNEEACAGAQIYVPGFPPAQCIYHDVKYAPNALICVAPSVGQVCGTDGVWSPVTGFGPCKNAPIPAPTYPAAPASK